MSAATAGTTVIRARVAAGIAAAMPGVVIAALLASCAEQSGGPVAVSRAGECPSLTVVVDAPAASVPAKYAKYSGRHKGTWDFSSPGSNQHYEVCSEIAVQKVAADGAVEVTFFRDASSRFQMDALTQFARGRINDLGELE